MYLQSRNCHKMRVSFAVVRKNLVFLCIFSVVKEINRI